MPTTKTASACPQCWQALALPRFPLRMGERMASLSVRKLDEETVARLRARAASHGVSMEEEARRILKDAVSATDRLGDLAIRIFGPNHGVDLELPEQAPHAPIDLTDEPL